jgi:hypothetical protein
MSHDRMGHDMIHDMIFLKLKPIYDVFCHIMQKITDVVEIEPGPSRRDRMLAPLSYPHFFISIFPAIQFPIPLVRIPPYYFYSKFMHYFGLQHV